MKFLMKIIVSLAVASVLASSSYAIVKYPSTEHTHTEAELEAAPIERFTPGHSGGMERNGGQYHRSSGLYHYYR